jgi:hypothetical protein
MLTLIERIKEITIKKTKKTSNLTGFTGPAGLLFFISN